jgi:hypothetical protein
MAYISGNDIVSAMYLSPLQIYKKKWIQSPKSCIEADSEYFEGNIHARKMCAYVIGSVWRHMQILNIISCPIILKKHMWSPFKIIWTLNQSYVILRYFNVKANDFIRMRLGKESVVNKKSN